MSKKDKRSRSLTKEQRKVVQDNLGLVAMCVNLEGAHIEVPRTDGERADLFQEGVLALMKAVQDYPRAKGRRTTFTSFAVSRIRNTMIRALEREFTTIVKPMRRRGPSALKRAAEVERHRPVRAIPVGREVTGFPDARASVRALDRDLDEGPDFERLADRIDERFHAAVQRARAAVVKGPQKRRDVGELVEAILRERLLVPSASWRASLRKVARMTQSSYTRVQDWEQRLKRAIRRELAADAVLADLRRFGRSHPDGFDALAHDVDPAVLARCYRDQFARRFQGTGGADRLKIVLQLLGLGDRKEFEVAAELFDRFGRRDQESFLQSMREVEQPEWVDPSRGVAKTIKQWSDRAPGASRRGAARRGAV